MAFQPNREELAWAAGFFDGEGSTSYVTAKVKDGFKRYVRMCIGQKDENSETLERFQHAVGGLGTIRLPYETQCGLRSDWICSKFEDCQAVVALLWHWLSNPKRSQAALRLTDPGTVASRNTYRTPYSSYGSKSKIVKLYPEASHRRIIEPFCGAAPYSFLYTGENHDVWINDLDPTVFAIWEFLTSEYALEWVDVVPPTVKRGQKVSQLLPGNAPPGLVAFCRAEANQGTQGARGVHDQITGIGEHCWNGRMIKRLKYVIPRVAHWKVTNMHYLDLPRENATWFVDPPYCNDAGNRYRQPASAINFAQLAEWCQGLPGQVIVCENDGATWLPFVPLTDARYGMKGRYQKSNTGEVVWHQSSISH